MVHALQCVVLYLQDLLEYKKKQRVLRVKTMDDSVKTMYVDDSLPVAQLMVTICSKMGKYQALYMHMYVSIRGSHARDRDVSDGS